MWNVEYWDDTSHQWHVGLTTGHQEAAEQLVSWLSQIGWESRIDEGVSRDLTELPSQTSNSARRKRFWLAQSPPAV